MQRTGDSLAGKFLAPYLLTETIKLPDLLHGPLTHSFCLGAGEGQQHLWGEELLVCLGAADAASSRSSSAELPAGITASVRASPLN